MFQPLSEAFIGRSWYSILLDLNTMTSRCVKKAVVHLVNWLGEGNSNWHHTTRWIKTSVHICKEGQRAMNRDEGNYQLSHTYDGWSSSQHPEELSISSLLMKALDERLWKRLKRQRFLDLFWLCNINLSSNTEFRQMNLFVENNSSLFHSKIFIVA